MSQPWEAGVQQTGRLSVFGTDAFLNSPVWGGGILSRLLDEFNRLAALYQLGVRMDVSASPPDPKGPGANVSIDTSLGPCSFFDEKGDPQIIMLPDTPESIMGRTALVGQGQTTRAFIFMPANPQLSPGRTVGPGVRMGLALHELIHACGLEESDPGHGKPNVPPIGDTDVFATGAHVFPGLDAQILPGTGKLSPDSTGQFFLTLQTVKLIQRIWLLGRF
jgi:hypothetical protein